MALCETTDFTYPLLADVYYPIVEQGAYGNLKKQWVLDRSIACFFGPAGRKYKEDIVPNVNVTVDNAMVGRTRSNILESTGSEDFSSTNIIITNIRDKNGVVIYDESSGPRKGQPTIYEIATFLPIVGPFGSTEYYKAVIRRSENQAVDL
jgi:hypothetical protein